MLPWPATTLLGLTHKIYESCLFGAILEPAATYARVLAVQYYDYRSWRNIQRLMARFAVNLAGTYRLQAAIPQSVRT